MRKTIERAIAEVHAEGRKTVLVVDQVDAWLATAGEGSGVTSLAVQGMLLGLREVSLTISAYLLTTFPFGLSYVHFIRWVVG